MQIPLPDEKRDGPPRVAHTKPRSMAPPCRATVRAKPPGQRADKGRADLNDSAKEKLRLPKGAFPERIAVNTIYELGNGDRKVGLQ